MNKSQSSSISMLFIISSYLLAPSLLCIGSYSFASGADKEGHNQKNPQASSGRPAANQTNREQHAKPKVQGKLDEVAAERIANAEYHFSMGQAYASDGDPDRAIEEYKLTLMFDPSSALVYSRLATEYIKKGMLSSAMETCKEALQRDPNYTDIHLILGGLYSTSHEVEAALKEYDAILKKYPKNEEAIVYKAQILLEDGKKDLALSGLKRFVKDNPTSAVVQYYLGRSEQQMDHFTEAESAYKKALTEKKGFAQAALALGYLYEIKAKNQDALQVYQRLYEETQDVSAASRLATIYLKEEKYASAIPYLEVIEASDPDDLNVRVKLGLIHMEMKHYSSAIEIFKKILEKSPDSDRIHYYLGSLYEETQKNDLAIQELKQVRSDSHLFPEAALHAAYLLKTSDRFDEAKKFVKSLLESPHRTVNFYLFDASLEEESKNFTAGILTLEKGVQEFPDNEKVRYYLGSLYDRQGKLDKSVEQMQAILKLNPENVDALNYIAYTWTQQGVNLNEVEVLLKRALRLKPENGYIQDSWGWYLLTRGRTTDAVVELEKAVKLKPNDSTILEHLGDAYLKSNLREKALAEYGDALKYSEDPETKDKILSKTKLLRKEMGDGSIAAKSPTNDR